MLSGAEGQTYSLVSAIQEERGARLFHPHFGFSFRAIKAKVKVYFVETASNTKHEMLNLDLSESTEGDWRYWAKNLTTEGDWRYWAKNLTTVGFLTTHWAAYTDAPLEWRVSPTKNSSTFERALLKHLVYSSCRLR